MKNFDLKTKKLLLFKALKVNFKKIYMDDQNVCFYFILKFKNKLQL